MDDPDDGEEAVSGEMYQSGEGEEMNIEGEDAEPEVEKSSPDAQEEIAN